ncbi:MAG: hypothetical protein KGJ24_03725 [Burkholderiales bacterium]|nr:hypothetical protein [Burkholderiales bacterium]MDE2564208.1 hypothetical protein [Burkholderiales bacterium]
MSAVPDPVEQVPALVVRLYEIVEKLECLFPGRRFTPDGHLIGSIGEVLAAHLYGLTLRAHSTQGHDATTSSGVQVEIKATQGNGVALRAEPQHLIVLQLKTSGLASEVYNGPGALAWNACGAVQRNGQRPISLSKLRKLMAEVSTASRLPVVRS